MKKLIKYGPQPPSNRDISSAEVIESMERAFLFEQASAPFGFLVPIAMSKKEGESRVTNSKGDRTDQQVLDLAALHKSYLGFPLFKSNQKTITNVVEIAKRLGKSFHLTEKEIKGSQNPKKNSTMKTFEIKRILVPTDFSETGMLAIEHAAFLAKLSKAHLYLLHIVESFEYAYSEYEPEIMVKDIEGIQEAVTEKLERLAASLENQYEINVTALVNNGQPASGISQTGKDQHIDLIVMGTHGAKGFEELIIGSNAHRVVNHAPCPVITVQSSAKNIGFTNIVMPIDNSVHSRQKVDYVIQLAKLYGSKIHILGLLEDLEESEERKFNLKLDAVESIIKQVELPYVRKLVTGHNVAVEAMKYADEVNADLLVIMTDHEESSLSLSGSFLGTLAKQVVNHSKIPVMSIRPVEHYRTYQEIF
ncbi:MAG TPA: universal stress protein [Bacteroidia bacterium]|nr:universal stress protein [Bacteroidia bacterium]